MTSIHRFATTSAVMAGAVLLYAKKGCIPPAMPKTSVPSSKASVCVNRSWSPGACGSTLPSSLKSDSTVVQGVRWCVSHAQRCSQSRTVLIRCHTLATAVADVCAAASPNPISGVVLVAPLPFLGPEMPRTATERMLGVAQVLRSSRDTVISARAKTDLVQGFFAGATCAVPDALKSSWLGLSMAQAPEVTASVLAVSHDPAKLLEAGRAGLPLMIVVGSQDALVHGPAVVGELRRHFRNAEAHVVDGGSHALFFDKQDEFVKLLLVFAGRLAVRSTSWCLLRVC